jgi:hypothetical protein
VNRLKESTQVEVERDLVLERMALTAVAEEEGHTALQVQSPVVRVVPVEQAAEVLMEEEVEQLMVAAEGAVDMVWLEMEGQGETMVQAQPEAQEQLVKEPPVVVIHVASADRVAEGELMG